MRMVTNATSACCNPIMEARRKLLPVSAVTNGGCLQTETSARVSNQPPFTRLVATRGQPQKFAPEIRTVKHRKGPWPLSVTILRISHFVAIPRRALIYDGASERRGAVHHKRAAVETCTVSFLSRKDIEEQAAQPSRVLHPSALRSGGPSRAESMQLCDLRCCCHMQAPLRVHSFKL
jgi:hypothetical protein